uniref:Coiled-coil domain-containing protein 171 n=1 Tax=Rodentolepis nana TaxID=102285 RepID=A0A0R3TNK9_RODNA
LKEWLIEKQLLNYKLNRESEERQHLEFLCVELQKTNLTPERLELIKCDLQRELQGQHDLKLRKVLKESELARNEHNRTMEDLEKLKIAYNQLQISFQNLHDKDTLIQESDRQFIAESHQEVVNRLSAILGSDTETLLNLFRENSQIRAQCNIILDETQKSNRLYDTQLSELKNDLIQTIDALTKAQSDRAILEEKCKVLQEEAEMLANNLCCTQTELKIVSQKVVDVEREKLSIQNRLIEECKITTNQYFKVVASLHCQMHTYSYLRNAYMHNCSNPYFILDLTNKMKLATTRYEESEAHYQQCEQEFAIREWDLQKRIKDTTEASKCRSVHILTQLERAQLNLKELSAQCKKLTMTLSEVTKQESFLIIIHIIELN